MAKTKKPEGPLNLTMDDVAAYARTAVGEIGRAHGSNHFKKLVCLSNGGLPVAYFFAKLLGIRDISVISVSSYGEAKERGQHVSVFFNGIVSDGGDVLIVDDLIETGASMRIAQSMFPNAKTATLLTKSYTKHPPDFKGGSTDKWVNFPWELSLENK